MFTTFIHSPDVYMRDKDIEIIEKIKNTVAFKHIVFEYRKKLGIPIEGLNNKKLRKEWNKTDKMPKEERDEVLKQYILDIHDKLSFLNIGKLDKTLRSLLHYSFFPFDKYSKDIKNLDFSLIYNKKGSRNSGIFIQISPFAHISTIRRFIDKNSPLIRDYQNKILKNIKCLNISQLYNEEQLNNKKEIIYLLSNMSMDNLRNAYMDFSGNSTRKNIVISNIMKKYYGYSVTPENISQIIFRERRKYEGVLQKPGKRV